MATEDRYVLRFRAARTESNLAQTFLRGGATLGGAVVRGETDFGVTVRHAQSTGDAPPTTFAASARVTETPVQIEVVLPVSERESASDAQGDAAERYKRFVAALNLDDGGAQAAATNALDEALFAVTRPAGGGAQLTISSRARLNVTATRSAPSIQGVIASTMSGQGSLELRRLWTRTDRPEPAVVQLPVVYAGWSHHSAVFAFSGAQIVRQRRARADDEWKDAETLEHVAPGSAGGAGGGGGRFFLTPNNALNAFLRDAEPQVKYVFDAAWERRQKIVYPASPYLTKAVARVPVGLNGSGYTLASSVNDPLPAFADEGVEALLRACVGLCCPGDEHRAAIERMAKRPSHADAKLLAEPFASALSLYQAITKPYRVDGTPVVLPGGTQMVEAESWLMEPSRSILTADDCDGSASCVLGVINAAVAVARRAPDAPDAPDALVTMRAVGRLFDTFYVSGVSVLGATAGHAAAANDDAPAVSGHAVAIAIPKRAVARALADGAAATIGKKPVHSDASEEGGLSALREARDAALFPPEALAAILAAAAEASPEESRLAQALYGTADARASVPPPALAGTHPDLPPLAMEGTAAADGRLFTHDEATRALRHHDALHDKEVSKLISPCVARNCSRLDAAGRGARHGFYSAFVELSLSTQHPLFADRRLRELNAATPHLVLVRNAVAPGADVADSKLHGAGVTPEQLAKNAFALVPLWTAGTRSANVLGAASAEARMNILPRRGVPLVLDKRQAQNLVESLSTLRRLRRALEKNGELDPSEPITEQVLSYAALVNNPRTVECYADTVIENLPKGTRGRVHIERCPHVARFADEHAAEAVATLEAESSGLDKADAELVEGLLNGQKVPIRALEAFFKAFSGSRQPRGKDSDGADAKEVSIEAGRIVYISLQVPRERLPLVPEPPPPAAHAAHAAPAPQPGSQAGGSQAAVGAQAEAEAEAEAPLIQL